MDEKVFHTSDQESEKNIKKKTKNGRNLFVLSTV